MADYDAIVIGAGHNGLTTSLLLQKNGLKVLELEKNGYVGGMAANVPYFPGHANNAGAWLMFLAMKEVWDMLEVEKYGFETIPLDTLITHIISPDRPAFTFYADPNKLFAHIQKEFGEQTAMGFMGLMKFLQPFSTAMKQAVLNPPLSIGKMIDSMPSIEGKDAMRRVFFSPIADLLNEFMPGKDADVLKGLMCLYSQDGFYGGPMTPGSAFNIAFHMASGEETGYKIVKGGIGKYSEAIAKAFEAHGGELRLKTPIKKVVIKNGKAVGVQLKNGEEISADLIISNCNASVSFLQFVGVDNLPSQFVGMVNEIKYRNPYIQVYYRLNELPHYAGRFEHINENKLLGFLGVSPDLMGWETAWDACKHGQVPPEPMSISLIPTIYDPSQAPEGEHYWCQFLYNFPINAPREQWKGLAEQHADRALDVFSRYAPNAKKVVLDRKIMTPADYEAEYNATNGCFDHGTLAIDQMFDNRPVPGWSNYTTPVDNFYLCGSAVHPGWGVTSFSGINAANAILKKWNKKSGKK